MAAKRGASKPMTKTEILNSLADGSGLSKKEIGTVFDELAALIRSNLSKKGPGSFNIPGLMKIVVIDKKATPAKKGVPNPFRPGELMDVAAKPARRTVKVRPLKGLKEMV